MLFADYHFHPNFKFGANYKKKANKILDAFENVNLDIVIISEHAWKYPCESYNIMLKECKQRELNIALIPGVETLTFEGLDLIVFSTDTSFYKNLKLKKLFKPYALKITEAIDLINNNNDIAGYFPHPFTRGTTGIVKYYGEDLARQLISKLRAVEGSNNSYGDFLKFLKPNHIKNFAPKLIKGMEDTQHIDKNFLKSMSLDFIAIGSDAHSPKEIGYGCLIDPDEKYDINNTENIFKALITNRNSTPINLNPHTRSKCLINCAFSAFTTSHEFIQKKKHRLRLKIPSKKTIKNTSIIEVTSSLSNKN